MIKINKNEVRNTVEELTVAEFEEVASIQQDEELDFLDKQIKMFTYLGVPEEELDSMDLGEFQNHIKAFNDVEPKEYPFLAEVEIDGFVYRAYEDEFKLTIKDLKHIENKVNETSKKYMAYVLGVIFKREDLTKTEHYDKAHLKHKEKLFSKLPAAIAIPYITYIGKELAKATEGETA